LLPQGLFELLIHHLTAAFFLFLFYLLLGFYLLQIHLISIVAVACLFAPDSVLLFLDTTGFAVHVISAEAALRAAFSHAFYPAHLSLPRGYWLESGCLRQGGQVVAPATSVPIYPFFGRLGSLGPAGTAPLP